MALKANQTECKCGVSVKTLRDVMRNGILRVIGKALSPHMFCKQCNCDWGKVS